MTVVPIGGEEARPAAEPPAPVGAHDPFPVGSLVEVTWHDAWFDFDQPDADDVRADYLVTTVGFLLRHGPRFLSIAQETLPDGDGYRAITHIPLSVVETMSPLHRPDEPPPRDRTGT